MSSWELQNVSSSPSINSIQSWYGLLEFEKTVFVIVNVMDIAMTSLLLSTGAFYESNPIADLIIDSWGLMGMTVFKLIVVAGVLLITNVIATRRLKTAQSVLYFGSAMVTSVVMYSGYLLWIFVEASA